MADFCSAVDMGEYVKTYIEAKKLADSAKTPRLRKPKDKGMGDLFDRP